MNVYLSGNSDHRMNIYLSQVNSYKNNIGFERLKKVTPKLMLLESFPYVRKELRFMELSNKFKSLMLDSGAFTFLQNKNKNIDWDRYVEEYADFIYSYKIDLFFELDIDSIIGLKKVEKLRQRLEQLTGKQPIPVWHRNRGKDYFVDMCKNYNYVALGGIAIKEININLFEKFFPWFINTAHENDCKIHGLGYTSIKGLHEYNFDSVDSTAWIYGNRGGYVFIFNPQTGFFEKIKKENCRLRPKEASIHNFIEWTKFQQYALKKL